MSASVRVSVETSSDSRGLPHLNSNSRKPLPVNRLEGVFELE